MMSTVLSHLQPLGKAGFKVLETGGRHEETDARVQISQAVLVDEKHIIIVAVNLT